MMRILGEVAEAPRLQVVSGRAGSESWDDISANRLDDMFKTFRSVFAQQLADRF